MSWATKATQDGVAVFRVEVPGGQSWEAEGSVSSEQPRLPMRVGATGVSESGRRLCERRPRRVHSFIHWHLPWISRQHPTQQGDRVLPWFLQGVEDVKRRHQGSAQGLVLGWEAPFQAGWSGQPRRPPQSCGLGAEPGPRPGKGRGADMRMEAAGGGGCCRVPAGAQGAASAGVCTWRSELFFFFLSLTLT